MRLLSARRVEHLVIGGYAVAFHGHPRATGGIDIWVGRTVESATALVQVLHEFGIDTPDVQKSLFLERGRVVRIGQPPLQIELFNELSGVRFEECYKRRVAEWIDHVEIPFISLPDLVANKRAAGRPQDLADLHALGRS